VTIFSATITEVPIFQFFLVAGLTPAKVLLNRLIHCTVWR